MSQQEKYIYHDEIEKKLLEIKQKLNSNSKPDEEQYEKLLQILILIFENFKIFGEIQENINILNYFYEIIQILHNNQEIIKINKKIKITQSSKFTTNINDLNQEQCEILLRYFCYNQIYLVFLSKCNIQIDSLDTFLERNEQQQSCILKQILTLTNETQEKHNLKECRVNFMVQGIFENIIKQIKKIIQTEFIFKSEINDIQWLSEDYFNQFIELRNTQYENFKLKIENINHILSIREVLILFEDLVIIEELIDLHIFFSQEHVEDFKLICISFMNHYQSTIQKYLSEIFSCSNKDSIEFNNLEEYIKIIAKKNEFFEHFQLEYENQISQFIVNTFSTFIKEDILTQDFVEEKYNIYNKFFTIYSTNFTNSNFLSQKFNQSYQEFIQKTSSQSQCNKQTKNSINVKRTLIKRSFKKYIAKTVFYESFSLISISVSIVLISSIILNYNLIYKLITQQISIFKHQRFYSNLQTQYNDEFKTWQTYSRTLFENQSHLNQDQGTLNNYNQTFWDIINQYKYANYTKYDIKNIIHNYSRTIFQDKDQIIQNDTRIFYSDKSNFYNEFTQTKKQQLITLVSFVSSYWTLYNYESKVSNIQFIKPTQIFTILNLLGVHSDVRFEYESNLIDINSIEDQQIVISITSAILQLLKYDVNVCHSSQFISQNNYQQIQEFFVALEINNNIKYSTINQIYEDILIQNYFVKNITKQEQTITNIQNNVLNNKILIFNDIDYLQREKTFSQPFYLEDKYISNATISLFQMIWRRRNENLTFIKIKLTNEYQSLFDENIKLNDIQDIIDFQIKKMLKDCQLMNNTKYVYDIDSSQNKIDIQIVKKDGTSIYFLKGYKNTFAILDLHDQLYQNQQLKIDWKSIFNNHLYLQINVGIFSYSYLKSYFKLVLGVNTNQLNNITSKIENIQIPQFKNYTKISSKNNVSEIIMDQINNSIIYNSIEDQFQKICSLISKDSIENRKTIILFKNQKQLLRFEETIQQNLTYKNVYIINHLSLNQKDILKKNILQNNIILSIQSHILDVLLIIKTIDMKNIQIIQTYIPFMVSDIILASDYNSVMYNLIVSKQQEDKEYKQISKNRWKEFINNNITSNPKSKQNLNFIMDIIQLYSQFESNYVLKQVKQNDINHNFTVKYYSQMQQFKSDGKLEEIQSKQLLDLQKKSCQIDSNTQEQVYGRHIGNYSDSNVDNHGNPISSDLELGRSDVFNESKLIIGLFIGESEDRNINFQKDIIPVLEKKGIKEFHITRKESEFTQNLQNYDQAWIIYGYRFQQQINVDQFVESVIQFHYSGKGLVLWSDNADFYYHTNLILKKLSFGQENGKDIQIQMYGNYAGQQIIKRTQNDLKCATFTDHFITTGINNMYEGITISYPTVTSDTSKNNFGELQIIGINSNCRAQQPALFAYEGDYERGRIVFDSGFTKLYSNNFYLTAGTSRYISNLYVYSYNLQRFELV